MEQMSLIVQLVSQFFSDALDGCTAVKEDVDVVPPLIVVVEPSDCIKDGFQFSLSGRAKFTSWAADSVDDCGLERVSSGDDSTSSAFTGASYRAAVCVNGEVSVLVAEI